MNKPPTPEQQKAIHEWSQAVNDLDRMTATAADLFLHFEHDAGLRAIEDLELKVTRLKLATVKVREAFIPDNPPTQFRRAA